MTALKDEIVRFNAHFVKNRDYERFDTSKYPNKKLAVISCMDTRLTELLPAAMNIKNGDVKIIKNAGATVSHPFGSVMRSVLIAVYQLGVQEIAVVGHYDCGMQGLDPQELVARMTARGISRERITMVKNYCVNLDEWLKGFDSAQQSVEATVRTIRDHPLMPGDVAVYGFLMDPGTGRLDAL